VLQLLMPKFKFELRFVVYREAGVWLAHCLEMDIVAEGRSAGEALADVFQLCAAQIEFVVEQGDIKAAFRAAPPEFWAMYSKAVPFIPSETPQWPAAVDVEKVVARELQLCG
jgi:hypothetical protein